MIWTKVSQAAQSLLPRCAVSFENVIDGVKVPGAEGSEDALADIKVSPVPPCSKYCRGDTGTPEVTGPLCTHENLSWMPSIHIKFRGGPLHPQHWGDGGSPEFIGQPVELNRCIPSSVRQAISQKQKPKMGSS